MTAKQDLALSWIDDIGALLSLKDEWQALAERTGAEIYLRPDWQAVWWEHFGAGRRLACLVARENGALVGLLPFSLELIWLGPLPLRIAHLAGTDPHCIVFDLPLDPQRAEPVLQAALTYLTGALGCLAVSFTPLSELAGHAALLRDLCRPGSGLVLQEDAAGSHVVFDLPDRFEDYLARLSKKRRGQFRRDAKGLEKNFAMTRDSIAPDATDFDEFVAFHNRQWQAVGRGGHFTDWPGSVDFYRDLAQKTGAAGPARLHRLQGTDGPLATQFALVAGRTAHWRLPARSLNPAAERLSAGKVGLLCMIEAMISNGITRIEAGRGEYDYKLNYGGRDVPVRRMIVRREARLAALGLALLLAWADLLNLLYYRIWFLKLAPRVQKLTGRRPHPLWRSWIRSRL